MDTTNWISKKIALLGSHAVGKTSLINQFVYNKFPESYLTTIGLKVDKKTVESGTYRVDMVIWDIAGQDNMANIPHYYLKGCSGVIYVTDLSRPGTYQHVAEHVAQLREMLPDADLIIAGNKADLLSPEELQAALAAMPLKPDFVTSALKMMNVAEMFMEMAGRLVKAHESQGV